MMPYMDGLEVTRRLRLEKYTTPILLLTARDAPEDVVNKTTAKSSQSIAKIKTVFRWMMCFRVKYFLLAQDRVTRLYSP